MRTWIERVPLGPRFAGREGNDLDRLKRLKANGWDLTVLTVKGADYVLVLGCREEGDYGDAQPDEDSARADQLQLH